MKNAPFSRIVRRDEVPYDGLEIDFVPTSEEREELARILGIPAVTSLTAKVVVSPWRARGLSVEGTVEAQVEQTCVVTLDPVANVVREDIEAYFVPEGQMPVTNTETGDGDDLDIGEMTGERIDIGVLAAEHVSLGLDPYPRKPGVVFDQGTHGSPEAGSGAFSALSVLKGGRKGD